MNTFSRGLKNAFRNSIRTFSIVVILGLSMGLALAMLVANQAVKQKITSVQQSIGNTVDVSPAGLRGFEGGGNPLTGDQIAKLTKLPHVTSVDSNLLDRLTSSNTNLQSAIDAGALGRRNAGNNGQGFAFNGGDGGQFGANNGGGDVTRTFTPPVTVMGTTDPTDLSGTQGGGTFTLSSGQVFAGNSHDNVAIVGKNLAKKNNLKTGSTFTAYGQTVSVVGIFDAGNAFSNNQVIMPLSSVQTLSSQPNDLSSATVHIDSVANIDSVTSVVKNTLGSAADVTNSAEQAKQTITPLQNIQKISLYSLIGAVVAGAVIILLTMVMIVRERRREIGVLKAIGASNLKIMLQFMTEATTLTVLGSIIGMVIGVLAGNPITRLLANNSTNSTGPATAGFARGAGGLVFRGFGGGARRTLDTLHGAAGWSIIVYGLVAAIFIGIVGSALASYFIAKIRPAEVMRAE